jgi:hypothetical protein
MPIAATAIANVRIVTGIAVGLFFNGGGQSWVRRQVATRQSDVTVGIAGAFTTSESFSACSHRQRHCLAALVGAFSILWLWRSR